MHARRPLAVLLAAVAVSLPLGTPEVASASCAAPDLRLAGDDWGDARREVAVGATVTVEGRGFTYDCDDTGTVNGFGCQQREEVRPERDVELHLEQRDRSWALGSADADADLRTEWRVTLPADARPGPARLVVPNYSEPLRITLTG